MRRCETKGTCVTMSFKNGNVTIFIHDSALTDDGTVLKGIAGVHNSRRQYSHAVALAPLTLSVYSFVIFIHF